MILLVDDDVFSMGSYIRALRGVTEVEVRNNAIRGFEAFAEDVQKWDGAILDVMMENEELPDWKPEHRTGFDIGLALAVKIREYCKDLPIVFLTNQRSAAVLDEIRSFSAPAAYLDKRRIEPAEFVQFIMKQCPARKRTATSANGEG